MAADQKIVWNKLKYTRHEHVAEFRIQTNTWVYDKPFAVAPKRANKVIASSTKIYTSKYKAKNQYNNAWYYFPIFDGWIPYMTSNGTKVCNKTGDTLYCSYDNEKETKLKGLVKKPDKSEILNDINELYNFKSNEYKDFLRGNLMIADDAKFWKSKFNRMQFANPYMNITGTREYIFFTRPDLNIFKPGTVKLNPEFGNDPFWLEMQLKFKDVIKELQKNAGGTDYKAPFIAMLSNGNMSSLDIPNTSLNTTETSSTIYGTNITYARRGAKSDESLDFSIEFEDQPHLPIYHFFKMWYHYETLKAEGVVSPPRLSSTDADTGKLSREVVSTYTTNKILHDQIGIYRIVTRDDMETILYYDYRYGSFPKNYPRESFQDIPDGNIKFNIEWHSQFMSDMDPLILMQFNNITRGYINANTDEMISLWDNDNKQIRGDWADCPYIMSKKSAGSPTGFEYKLKWFNKR